MKTLVLIDGQNLYHLVREAWAPKPHIPGSPYGYPSYDVEKLAAALVARVPGRKLSEVRFYTGVPSMKDNPYWHGFWNNKLRALRARGVHVYRGRINYGQEKGVDVSLATDLIKMTYEQAYDAAIIVSQDTDFGPAVQLAKEIARDQNRFLYFESAFVVSAASKNPRGVPGTKWVAIDRPVYDACIDPTDYRP